MNRKSALREEAVMQQAINIEGLRVDARHVGIPEHEIHVVDRVNPAEQRSQFAEPLRVAVVFLSPRPTNQKGNLLRINLLQRLKLAARIAADSPQQITEFMLDNGSSDVLMRHAVLVEVMVVKKVPERAMAHIVQKAGHPDQALHQRPRRDIRATGGKRFVPDVDHPRCEVHHAENMLKSHMLGGREDPPGCLELVDMPHPLHPRVIDDLLLGDLAGRQPAAGDEGDIPVDRVVSQAFRGKITSHAGRSVNWQKSCDSSLVAAAA